MSTGDTSNRLLASPAIFGSSGRTAILTSAVCSIRLPVNSFSSVNCFSREGPFVPSNHFQSSAEHLEHVTLFDRVPFHLPVKCSNHQGENLPASMCRYFCYFRISCSSYYSANNIHIVLLPYDPSLMLCTPISTRLTAL